MATVPKFIYGTAWKEDKTAELTFQALQAGFRAIDTANQRKHYYEEGVGQGIKKFLDSEPTAKRRDLFLQSKFTYSRGQDHRKPYSDQDSFTKQVGDSFASSLKHLGTDYLDSYILHGPYQGQGIAAEDLEVWSAMEKHRDQKQTHFLGVSNVNAEQLRELCQNVRCKPNFVQNRCFANTAWDREIREICKQESIDYQGFSLLTANRGELASKTIVYIAKAHNKTIPQIIFRFTQQVGIICLTGSGSLVHLREDLAIEDFELNSPEISKIENISFQSF